MAMFTIEVTLHRIVETPTLDEAEAIADREKSRLVGTGVVDQLGWPFVSASASYLPPEGT